MPTEDPYVLRWKAIHLRVANGRLAPINSPAPFTEDALDPTNPSIDFLASAASALIPPTPTLKDAKEILIQSISGGSKYPIYHDEKWYMDLLGGKPKIWDVHIVLRKDFADTNGDAKNPVVVDPPIIGNPVVNPPQAPIPHIDVKRLGTPEVPIPHIVVERLETPVVNLHQDPVPRRRPVLGGRTHPKKRSITKGSYIDLDDEEDVNLFFEARFPEFEAKFNRNRDLFQKMFHNLKWNWTVQQLEEYGDLLAIAIPHHRPWAVGRFSESAGRVVQRFVSEVLPEVHFKRTHMLYASVSAEKIELELNKKDGRTLLQLMSGCHK